MAEWDQCNLAAEAAAALYAGGKLIGLSICMSGRRVCEQSVQRIGVRGVSARFVPALDAKNRVFVRDARASTNDK